MSAATIGEGARRGAFVVGSTLAVALALFSFRYLAPHAPFSPVNVAGNAFAWPWLPAHAALSAAALLIGPFQFMRTRTGARRDWHRWSGRTYAACCLLSAPAGLILAFGATTGPTSTAGFGSLSIIWFAVTTQGWVTARARRFAEHRRWMIRSYALTFGAVTLRLYLAIALAANLDFAPAYRAISFLAWVPNLLLAEAYLRWPGRGGRTAPAPERR